MNSFRKEIFKGKKYGLRKKIYYTIKLMRIKKNIKILYKRI